VSWDALLAWAFALLLVGAFLWLLGQLVLPLAILAGLAAMAVLIWELRQNVLR
jgi:hypothetical protein